MKLLSFFSVPFALLFSMFLLSGSCSTEQVNATVLNIPELQCMNCETCVQEALQNVEGIKMVHVDAEKNTAEVRYLANVISLDEIRHKIADAGYSVDGIETTPEAVAALPQCCRPPEVE